MTKTITKTEGRMIKKSISNSKGFAELSPQAAVLFCMILPHLNSHGKLNGGYGYIKDEICPFIKYLTLKSLPSLLKEISANTNLKHFSHQDRLWLHAIHFLTKHQKLQENRLGQDLLPSYSGVALEEVYYEDKSKIRVREVEVEEEVEGNSAFDFESLWALYPRQEGKKEAMRHLKASVGTEEQFSACRRAIGNYKAKLARERTDPKYVMQGKTFFNNWQDYENYKGGENHERKDDRPVGWYNEPCDYTGEKVKY